MPPAPIKINHSILNDYLSTQEAQLPRLPDVTDLTDRVIRVMGGNPGLMQLQGTNTYLVGTGQSRILIDTGQGFDVWRNNLVDILESRGLDISHILLTHWHGDHTGGVPSLIEYRPEFASRIYKNQPDPGQLPIEDGQIFKTQGATLRAILTPGHAVDHMCFVLHEENAIFCGDNILGHNVYSVVEDLGAYMQSLTYMNEQNCAAGYPAHGAKIDNFPQKMKTCIKQKETRERQIYSTLMVNRQKLAAAGQSGKGSLSTRELVTYLHGDVQEDIYELALEPFTTEVLCKLAEDRKVGFELGGGCKRWFINERTWKKESRVMVVE